VRKPATAVLLLFAALLVTDFRATTHRSSFILAGEPISIDVQFRPQFSSDQMKRSTAATRDGFARFAATEEGQKLIAFLDNREFRIDVAEDENEPSPGRAPQPPLATLVAAKDHTITKDYALILNPTYGVTTGFTPLPGQPVTPSDIMATAWAAETLHIYFYSRGISLPHHKRADFQHEWRLAAAELGFPAALHQDDKVGQAPQGARVIYW
jgi:hypothetical protein